jgi:hypothetical protein
VRRRSCGGGSQDGTRMKVFIERILRRATKAIWLLFEERKDADINREGYATCNRMFETLLVP